MAHPESLVDEILDRRERYQVLAAEWNCGYLDVESEWIDSDLLAGRDPEVLARDGWLPLHHDDEGYVLVVTAVEPTPERVAMMEQAVGGPVCVAVGSDWDVEEAIRRAFARPPAARRRPAAGRWLGVGAALAGLVLALTFATGPTVVTVALLVSGGHLAGVAATLAIHFGLASARGRAAVGPSVALLLTPPAYALFVAALVLPAQRVVPAWALGVVLASPLVGQAALVHAELLDAFRRGEPAGPALRSPIRWLQDCVAAYRNLLTREKHGNRAERRGDPAVATVEPG
ncbi:hypothetical protein O7635_32475 [Asanoa sp. WMMD1127]|uniref:GspE/PulE/PilB domain-containing protein n=1 Tax=Asanoa sp. WMMD1127 TaxID=3016107 RepID=UPI00241749BF|nr:hypothetical protein [Asanoa sp. WMMD1127]MDG4826591.1 hypothetical protein [Asanoa sp. WMMD1127]